MYDLWILGTKEGSSTDKVICVPKKNVVFSNSKGGGLSSEEQ
jgi:hypothetical protein